MKRHRIGTITVAALILCPLAAALLAVQPATWNQTTEADFATGKCESTVTSSLGEIALARQIKVLAGSDSAPAVVSCVAVMGGTLYAGAGSEPAIFKVENNKAVKFAELPATMIGCLAVIDGKLLAGACGDKAGVYRIDEQGKSKALWTDEKVKYVWAIVAAPDGGVYAATGPGAQVFAVDKDGKAQVAYSADKLAKNVLCLAVAGGKLYAGTGEKGLVVEIDPKAATGRVLLEAAEKEISALVVGEHGELLAATADTSKAMSGGASTPSTAKEGKTDMGGATSRPAPARPAAAAPPSEKKPEPAPAPSKAPAPAAPEPAKDKPADKPKEGEKPKDDAKPAGNAPGATAAAGAPAPVQAGPPTSGPAPVGPTVGAGGGVSVFPYPIMGGARPVAGPPTGPVRIISMPMPPGMMMPTAPAAPAAPQGNAVYVIRPDGLVETIFRKPVTILAMVRSEGKLILATGNGGGVYALSPDGDEVALIVHTDAAQVTSLAVGADGEVIFGTANKGSVGRIDKGFAPKGVFLSKAMDASQIAQWGTLQVRGRAPEGTEVTIATRSGNVSEPDDKTWSSWSKEMSLQEGFLPIGTPAGRFLQYRLSLASKGPASPQVNGVEIVYQVGNLAPAVGGIAMQPSDKGKNPNETTGGPKAYRLIALKVGDQNNDKLRFTLEFRETGTEGWIKITDELMEPRFVWDTRGVGDGRYELRATASDDPSNPPGAARSASRVSEPFLIDNSAPVVKDLAAKLAVAVATVSGLAEDTGSRVESIGYAVDSQEKWTAVLPSDGICDSGREKFSFEVKDLAPGTHRIAVRVEDIFGNVGFGAVTVTVGK